MKTRCHFPDAYGDQRGYLPRGVIGAPIRYHRYDHPAEATTGIITSNQHRAPMSSYFYHIPWDLTRIRMSQWYVSIGKPGQDYKACQYLFVPVPKTKLLAKKKKKVVAKGKHA